MGFEQVANRSAEVPAEKRGGGRQGTGKPV
uniref:Uncharacterized protein n=1 Tax=Siphoviridae sp. ctN5F10 TaxID=2825465 RepID=A0A8S5UF48_9CAUD|nr:MAG TPA: hypothetical protein [Siphoviridae sp. ctN5F10]